MKLTSDIAPDKILKLNVQPDLDIRNDEASDQNRVNLQNTEKRALTDDKSDEKISKKMKKEEVPIRIQPKRNTKSLEQLRKDWVFKY